MCSVGQPDIQDDAFTPLNPREAATRARVFAGIALVNPARFPRNPVEWLPTADKLPPGLRFVMQRDNPNPRAKDGSKEFSGFTSAADAVAYARW